MSDSTQGTAPSTQQGEGDAPKYATADDVAKIVNQAISARTKTYDAKIEKSLTDFSTAFATKLDELSTKLTPATQAAEPKPGSAEFKIEETPQFRSMQKQLSELKNAREKADADAAAMRAKNADQAMRSKVATALAEAGIDPKYMKHALGHLVDAQKTVRIGEDGESLIFKDADGGDLDFSTGLKGWVGSDDAKIYLPPRGAAGSGASTQTNTAARGNAPPDAREQLAALLLQRGQ